MLIELFIIFQIITVGLFFTAFYTKQEIIWAMELLFAGFMMISSWHVEYYVYEFNQTMGAYTPIVMTHYYPYMMGINMVFLVLSLLLGLFDIFDKYGGAFVKKDN